MSTTPLNTTTTTTTLHLHGTTEQAFMFLGAGIVSLATMAGNLLVVKAYKRNKHLQTITNIYLISLSISDILVSIFALNFYVIYVVLRHWHFGVVLCDAYLVLDYVCCQISVNHLLLISFDRYFLITRPITYKVNRTMFRAKLWIAIIWLVSIIQWAPWILAYPFIVGKRTVPEGACYVQFIFEMWYLSYLTAIFAYYLPLVIIILTYIRMYWVIKRRLRINKNVRSVRASSFLGSTFNIKQSLTVTVYDDHLSTRDNIDNTEIKREANINENVNALRQRKAARMLVIIVSGFALTWLPYNIHVILAPFCPQYFTSASWDLSYLCCYINSTINPICYALGSPGFKKEFLNILCYRRTRRIVPTRK